MSRSFARWIRRHVVALRRIAQTLFIVIVVLLALILMPGPVFAISVAPHAFVLVCVALAIILSARILLIENALSGLQRIFSGLSRPKYVNSPMSNELKEQITDRYWSAYAEFVGDAKAFPIEELVTPSSFVRRISDHRRLSGGRWNVSLTRTVEISADHSVVPIVRFAKGRTLGPMKVEVDGKRARTADFEVSKGLVIDAVETAWRAAFGSDHLDTVKEIVSIATSDVALDVEAYGKLKDKIALHLRSAALPSSEEATLDLLIEYALTCEFVFVVMEDLPEDQSFVMRRVTVEFDELRVGALRGLVSRFRALLGIGERNFTIPLDYLSETKSYHLSVEGPEGMYVYDIGVYSHEEKGIETSRPISVSGDLRSRSPMILTSERVGDEFGHLYLRDFDGVASAGSREDRSILQYLRVKLEFREIPPGLLGPVMIVALWLTVLTWVVGWSYDLVFTVGQSGALLAGSWPAVIFGVPALVTGWLLSRASQAAVRITAIPVFLCLLWLALNAAVLIMIVALVSAGVDLDQSVDLGLPGFLTVRAEHAYWFVMMISTLSNFLTSAIMLAIKSHLHAEVVNNKRD